MNNLAIVGRMGKDPELTYLEGGTAIAKFSVAVQRPFKDKKSGKYEADWFDVVCFGKTAEFTANHCGKGRIVSCVGRHERRTYQTQDGSNRVAWELKADAVNGVGPSPNSDSSQTTTSGGDAYDDPFEGQ